MKNFPPVCSEGTNFDVSTSKPTVKPQPAPIAQPYRYSEDESQPLLSEPSLYFPEAQLNPLTAYTETGTEAGHTSGMVTELITQGHQIQPLSYSYRMVYPKLPLVFVYMGNPYALPYREYTTGTASAQYTPTALTSSEEVTVNGLLSPEGLALMNGVDTSLPTPPSKLTWYSIRQLATDNPLHVDVRPVNDGSWDVSEQTLFQTLHPVDIPITDSQTLLLSGEGTGTDLATFPADLSGTASAVSEATMQLITGNQATGALGATVSLDGFYHESNNEFGRAGTMDSSTVHSEVLPLEKARVVGQAGGGMEETSEQPSQVFSSEYKDKASRERKPKFRNAEIRRIGVQLGGVKGDTKGMVQAQRKSWTQNKIMYSG